jgi:hypothetical protein
MTKEKRYKEVLTQLTGAYRDLLYLFLEAESEELEKATMLVREDLNEVIHKTFKLDFRLPYPIEEDE